MARRKWMSLIISTSLVSSGLLTLPASAQQAPNQSDITGTNINQSDITGTNIWNNTAPIFRNNGTLKPEIINNARRLSQELEGASERCCNTPPPAGPRRFARGPADPNEVCLSPDCERLNSLVEETKVFINDVTRSQTEQVSANRNRIW
jgi:hypothetical protein